MTYLSEVNADSPAGHWRQGEPSGTTMTDSSGNGRGGTYSSVTLGATSLLVDDADTAATYGAGSSGTVTNAAWMNTTTFTAEAIIKPSTVSGTHVILSRHNSGASEVSWTFRLEGTQLKMLTWGASGGGMVTTTASTTFAAGTTYHVAVTVSGGINVTVYVNGASVGSSTRGTAMQAGTAPLRVGASFAGENFAGVIDEAAFYVSALSAGRLDAHYDASIGVASIIGTLSATLPRLTASLTGTYVVGTDTSNRDWARRRGGIGLVTVEVPVAPVPPTRTRAPRVTKAVPLPTPTMVDGRPT